MKNNIFLCLAAVLMMATYTACKSDPSGGELSGSYWTLASLELAGKSVQLPKNGKPTLVFSEGKLNGSAPCNSYFAAYDTKDASIKIGELGATKRMCEQMELESAYFSLLSKAQQYGVRKDKLEITCANGQLMFFKMKDDEAAALRYSQGVGRLAAQFPVLEADGALHLHPIVRVDSPGNYPFLGTLVDTSFYKYFSADIREIWIGGGGEVMAIGQFGGFYICRVPGRYVSSDIALFVIQNGEMKHLETVAWAWCDEGWCNQQDAWLGDVDGDGLNDVVQHYSLTDDRGKLKEERMTFLRQDDAGELLPDASVKLDRRQYRMAKI